MNQSEILFSKLSLDFWLIYGSFCYGFETKAEDVSEDSLKTRLLLQQTEDFAHIDELFQKLHTNPKGLLRSELRFYVAEDTPLETLPQDLQNIFPLTLITEIPPVPEHRMGSEIILNFRFMQGMTPKDSASWKSLKKALKQP